VKEKAFYFGRKGNVYIPVRQYRRGKYVYFLVEDYTCGRRKQISFANGDEAKKRADDIAEALAAGEKSLLELAPEKRHIVNALELLAPTGLRIDYAAQILVQALNILQPGEIVTACKSYDENRPKNLIAKTVNEFTAEFLARQKSRISERRYKTNSSYIAALTEKLGCRQLHEIRPTELSDFVNGKAWSKKTRNDILGLYACLWSDAIVRKHATTNPASPSMIKREKVGGTEIGISQVDEVKRLLNVVEDALKPSLALWFFSGCRIAEIARLTVTEVRAGLKSGCIYLEGRKTKTGVPRAVTLCENLNAWLMRYLPSHGPVLPERWSTLQGLSELGRYIGRHTGISWKKNGPRHSFATYSLALHKDAPGLVRAMGNSLIQLERHYWARAASVTEADAKDYFSIVPAESSQIIAMPSQNKADKCAENDAPMCQQSIAQPTSVTNPNKVRL
jgi:integrase